MSVKMKPRDALSVFAGPDPGIAGGKLLACSYTPPGFSGQKFAITGTGGEYVYILFQCTYSALYNQFGFILSATGTPDATLAIFAADANGEATGTALASEAFTDPATLNNGGSTLTLTAPVQLYNRRFYVARLSCQTAGETFSVYTGSTTSSVPSVQSIGDFLTLASCRTSTGAIQYEGGIQFMWRTASGNKYYGSPGAYPQQPVSDFFDAAGNYTRVGFAHTLTETRMVYSIRVHGICSTYSTFGNVNTISAYIYKYNGSTWDLIYTTGAKKIGLATTVIGSLHFPIPGGVILERTGLYAVVVGPTTAGAGSATDRTRMVIGTQYAVIPRNVNPGQYGGIGEDGRYPVYYSGAGPVAFANNTTGTSLCVVDVGYHYRIVPAAIV